MRRLTIRDLIEERSEQAPDAVAILAPGRAPLTYARLRQILDEARRTLNAAGIRRGDRVATALANGPEMAVTFLAVASGAVCAPLNPGYREAEFDFYLSDLKPKALILDGSAAAAAAAAQARGIPLIHISPVPDSECGVFWLDHDMPAAPADETPAEPDDVALVLHTSGTTSRPKLVPLTNANLHHSARNIACSLALGAADRCLNVMPLFHIHGLEAAVLASLAAGGSVVCTPGFVAPRFFEWMEEFAPSWYTAVPTMHQAVLARAAGNAAAIAKSRLRFIRSCSAPLPPPVMAELERVFQAPVVEAYGMTEAAHQMACNPLPPAARKPGSVGIAAGPAVAIMDEAGTLRGAGESGEIVIRGPNVTPGYYENADANERAFTQGWFRTGDLGHLDEDGYLFISGRTKEIINRGGEKIAPREVDEVLLEHPAVAQALAFALPDMRLGEDVGAAVVLRPGSAVTEFELREFAARKLSDFKVPRRIVFLDEIPKGPTGKPQRIGLAAKLDLQEPDRSGAATFLEPRTAAEELVCGLWRGVLAKDSIGVLDNFFELGGDSVLAMQLLARFAEVARAEMPLLAFFAAPTVEAMADWLEAAPRPEAQREAPRLAAQPRTREMPLSFAQQRMWFLAQLEKDQSPYVRPAAYRLRGALDVAKLRCGLDRIVARHEALRTIFPSQGGVPVQVVTPPRPVEFEQVDLSAEPERIGELAAAQVRRPFDLARDQMLRVTLVKLGKEEQCLLVAMHHIASDGWSSRVFLRELAALYRGEELPDLAAQYGDYAVWQRSWLQGDALNEQLSYWQRQLEGSAALLPLPVDRPRPQRQSFRGARETLEVPAHLARDLKELSRKERATLFMTLLTAFYALLHRYSGAEEIVVGCPVANRTRAEADPLIGLFVNTLAMRAGLSGGPSFRELLARVRQVALGAYAHQDVAFEKLVETLHLERSLSYAPLFQVMFQLRNLPAEVRALGPVELEPLDFDPGVALYDLTLDVAERAGALHCVLDYNTDLFDRATARQMLEHYGRLLESAVREPDTAVAALPLLSEPDRLQALEGWNRTARDWPPELVPDIFERQAARTPDSVALLQGAERLTFAELNGRANRLAWHLLGRGVGPEKVVGVRLERSVNSVVATLGVLKAGAAFLPLDPSYPADRLGFMTEDAGAALVVTERDLAASGNESIENPPRRIGADNLAYAIYTSGSTGRPKGVEGLHGGLINRLRWMWEAYPFEADEICCHKTALGFVDSIAEMLGPLAAGVPLLVLDDAAVKRSPLELIRTLERHAVTRIVLIPSLLSAILETMEGNACSLPRLKHWVASGERLALELTARFRRLVPHGVLVNLYGSSEVAADATYYETGDEAGPDVPIGRPIANTRVYILDADLQPVPPRVPGELYVGGTALARGYINRPDLTAERFLPDPHSVPGQRLFRTGDMARRRTDGRIEFLGRNDDQVKVRGYRIEPAEIESALMRHPDVEGAAAGARGEGVLAAYVVSQGADAAALRSFLKRILPDYMVPSQFVFLDALPLLPNGKVDRKALARMKTPAPGSARNTAPRDGCEQRLAAIWKELLGGEMPGIYSDFFDLGGHSLLAARLMAKVEEAFGIELPVALLFEAPTIAQLSAIIRGESLPACLPGIVPLQPQGSRTAFVCVGAGHHARPLAMALHPDQPFFGLVLEDRDVADLEKPYCVERIAAYMVERLRHFQPRGPYFLGGHSFYGLCAYEMARQLRAEGERVPLVLLFDSFIPWRRTEQLRTQARIREHATILWRLASGLRVNEAWAHVSGTAKSFWERCRHRPRRVKAPDPATVMEVLRTTVWSYRPEPYPGSVVFIEAEEGRRLGLEASYGWKELVQGELQIHVLAGDHAAIFAEANTAALSGIVDDCLARAKP
ncbi:MAG TPA: amino acid adenylation domain-containing protein [Bryobacteraceae bacterium]